MAATRSAPTSGSTATASAVVESLTTAAVRNANDVQAAVNAAV
ncbi:unnamed protein product, partial [Tilletia laevis]